MPDSLNISLQPPSTQAELEETVTFSIGDLAREFKVTTRTIRFYEDKGLLSPTRAGHRRIYTQGDRVRLRLVLRGKRLGFSLDEIADIIEMYDTEPGETGQLHYLLKRYPKKCRQAPISES